VCSEASAAIAMIREQPKLEGLGKRNLKIEDDEQNEHINQRGRGG
jgi:hypothetical protein